MPEGPRWEAVERIYHQAIERPLAERNAFLESACAGDHVLRRELDSLLANEGPSFLEKSALGVAARDMYLTASWIGRRIGGYEVLALLGAGGMGEVYRARDISLGREVALKLLPREVARDPDRLNRLHREARLLASLNHHRIATLYGLEESDGQRFLVMELVLGQTLAERLRHGALPVREALEVSRQIAEGLEAAHEAGIVHRDLKPANIKVTPDGRVKLLDFGLAKALAPSSGIEPTQLTDTATRAGTVLGTAAYMSPEQARGQTGRPADRRLGIRLLPLRMLDRPEGLCRRHVYRYVGSHPRQRPEVERSERRGTRRRPPPTAALSSQGCGKAAPTHWRRPTGAGRNG